MENLPFGRPDYRQFQNTFLASVIVGMTYPQVADAASHTEQWGRFTRALFSVEPMEGIFQRPLTISRSDNKLGFVFDTWRTQVHISGDGYQNFADSVIPHAYKLKEFVTEVAGCQNPLQVGIRKIDIFQIKAEKGKTVDEKALRNHFFSEVYLSQVENKVQLDPEERNQMPGMLKHIWAEASYRLTVRSTFVKLQGVEDMYRIVLDTDEQYTPEGGVNLDKLDEWLKEMNKDLYKAFMWCVSDNVKRIMEKGKE